MSRYDATETLRKVFERVGIPESYYSIGKYKEGATCIEKTDKGYLVYNAERAEKNEKKEHKECIKVALDVISRIAMTKEDEKYFKNEFSHERAKESLEEVLESNNVPHYYYSLEGYAEEAVCLDRTAEGYLVYIGERGNKHDKKEYQNEKVREAAFDVISRLSESDEEERKMQSEFVDILINDLIDLVII